jgi:hypothetical protein
MTRDELARVLELHAKWLANNREGKRADLRYADLRYADLRYANLRNVDLYNSDLRYANLRYVDLRYANLRNADLYNANLRNVDLRNVDLRNANLRNADLRNADLRNADLQNADLSDSDLSDVKHNCKHLLCIKGMEYTITIIDDMVRVGCQHHSYETWKKFSPREIQEMDGEKATIFYPKLLKILTEVYND